MRSRQGLLFAMVLVAFYAHYIEGKSIGRTKLKDHSIKKRSSYFLWQDTCPPPDFTVEEVNCTDTCHSDDDCIGNLLCCDNGCKMCMDPVLPPPVIDWLGSPESYHRGFAAGGLPQNNHIEIDLKEPHFEEVECAYNGRTFARGETFFKGCHRCQCNMFGVSCEVGPCKIVRNPKKEKQSGEGSGEDVLRLQPVEALELSGDTDEYTDDHLEISTEPEISRFEQLVLHREKEKRRQAEVRIIPSILDQKRLSGNGEDIEHSGREESEEDGEKQQVKSRQNIEQSGRGESEEDGERQQVKSREHIEHSGQEEVKAGERLRTNSREDTEHGGHEELEELFGPRPKLRRRILRKQQKNEEDIDENVFVI